MNLQIVLFLLISFVMISPIVVQESFGESTHIPIKPQDLCEAYNHDPKDVKVFEIMEKELSKNTIVSYFISKFPDYEISRSVDESSPPWFNITYESNMDNGSVVLTTTVRPCIENPHPRVFTYHSKDNNINVKYNNYDLDSNQLSDDNMIINAINESIILQTHQKWINYKGQSVYVFPESVDALSKRGYIVEKSSFFNFGK